MPTGRPRPQKISGTPCSFEKFPRRTFKIFPRRPAGMAGQRPPGGSGKAMRRHWHPSRYRGRPTLFRGHSSRCWHIFRLALWADAALSLRVTGAFLNAIGILLGGFWGLALRKPLSLRTQVFFRSALGLSTFFFGLRLVWLSVGGTFLSTLEQILIVLLAVTAGFWMGKLLRLQKWSNRIGRRAGNAVVPAQTKAPGKAGDGVAACTVLFCAAPLGWLGAVTDGLSGYFWLLAVKAIMDAMAMTSFVKIFRWPAALSAFPVLVLLGGITLACRLYAAPFLESHSLHEHSLIQAVNAAAGLVACAVVLVIFEVRKVELANFLPGLVLAPLFAWLFR